MISVVIPTLNSERELARCLSALVAGVVSGVVREVIVVDGGSSDHTRDVAKEAGVTFVASGQGRGAQLSAGAEEAKGSWLLFLHSDTVLETGWDEEVLNFTEKIESGVRADSAAAFQFALDDDGMAPRFLEWMVGVRSNLLARPYGDQGLLITRALFDEVGGYRPIELMEDLDIVSRLSRGRITVLRSRAITCPRRYREDGYLSRAARNQLCLLMYALGVPMSRITRVYNGKSSQK